MKSRIHLDMEKRTVRQLLQYQQQNQIRSLMEHVISHMVNSCQKKKIYQVVEIFSMTSLDLFLKKTKLLLANKILNDLTIK